MSTTSISSEKRKHQFIAKDERSMDETSLTLQYLSSLEDHSFLHQNKKRTLIAPPHSPRRVTCGPELQGFRNESDFLLSTSPSSSMYTSCPVPVQEILLPVLPSRSDLRRSVSHSISSLDMHMASVHAPEVKRSDSDCLPPRRASFLFDIETSDSESIERTNDDFGWFIPIDEM